MAKRLALLDRPMLDPVPGGVEGHLVIKKPDPQSGKRADPPPAAAIGAAHLEEALEANLGEGGRQMIDPVAQPRLLAGKRRQPAVQEIAEALPGGVDILAVAEDEIHRHVERIVAIALVAEATLEHERKHSGAVRVGV